MSIELLHIDCMEYMRGLPDKAFDLAIVDPPYGGDKIFNGSADFAKRKQYDNVAPSPEYFDELRRVSYNQVICGGNYFNLPPTRGIVFWYKHVAIPNYSAGELIWTSFDRAAKCFDYAYTNIMDGKSHRIKVDHPTAKPVALYRWLLKNYAKPGQRILDTHLGSGSIAIACDIEGFDLVGCEIDADYIAAARKRLADHQAQPRMFAAEPAPTPVQLSIE